MAPRDQSTVILGPSKSRHMVHLSRPLGLGAYGMQPELIPQRELSTLKSEARCRDGLFQGS